MSNTATAATETFDLAHIKAHIAEELILTDCYLKENIKSSVPLVNQMISQLVKAGGKRIRPTLALLLSKLFNDQGKQQAMLAAVTELLHSATLLHDDVVDQSDKRRGNSTAHHHWGNKAAILVGDFLYARCFDMLASLDSMTIMQVYATASGAMAKGEILQLTSPPATSLNIDHYLSVIEHKTARLFMAVSQSAAILGAASATDIDHARDFGLHFGMAYQLIDDCLDYTHQEDALDKNTGDDLAEGKCTLPILYALQQADPQDHQRLKNAIEAKDRQQLPMVKDILHRYHAIPHTQKLAQQYSSQALLSLQAHQEHPSYAMLEALVQYNLQRCH